MLVAEDQAQPSRDICFPIHKPTHLSVNGSITLQEAKTNLETDYTHPRKTSAMEKNTNLKTNVKRSTIIQVQMQAQPTFVEMLGIQR